MAACVRHAQRVTVHLQSDDKVVPLTVFPQERVVHCPIDMGALVGSRLTELEVLHVEPALLRPPGDAEQSLVGDLHQYHPLGPLLWELAMRGSRADLLPEISGPAAYRMAPGVDLSGLQLGGAMLAAVERLQKTNHESARPVGVARLRPRTRDAPAECAVLAGRADHQPHASGGHERSWFGGLTR